MQPCATIGLGVSTSGASRIKERNAHWPETQESPKSVLHEDVRREGHGRFHGDLAAWRAATAGLRGGWEGVEGEVRSVGDCGEDAGVFGHEWWEKMGDYLRDGLAEGVRMTDAMGREARGDGSLV